MWYIEIIDCRDRGAKTGKGAAFHSQEKARASFDAARALEVEQECAEFLLDLHDPDDNLIDTIRIDAAGFETIVGESPASADAYTAHDRAYWQAARRDYRRAIKQTQAAS